MQTVQDVMCANVVKVSPEMTPAQVSHIFAREYITGAPVTDPQGQLVGVITASDLARQVGMPGPDHHTPLEAHERGLRIGDIMTRLVLEVEEDTPVAKALDLMLNFRVHRVVVTRDKQVVGIVSALDLLRLMKDMLR